MKNYKKLETFLDDNTLNYQKDYSISPMHHIKVGGKVDYFVWINNVDELKKLQQVLIQENIKYKVIGGFTNIILSDKGYDGVFIQLFDKFMEFSNNKEFMKAGTGVSMKRISRESRILGLTGLQYGSNMPGTVGGAVFNNSNAFGQHTIDFIHKITIMDKDGNIEEIGRNNIDYKGRDTFKDKIILDTTFKLEKANPSAIDEKSKYYNYISSFVRPIKSSTGSIFADYKKAKAYQMIERVGANSISINGAHWYSRFPNFILNDKQATASDVYFLIKETEKVIFKHYNVKLEMLVELLGDFTDIEI